MSLIAMGNEKKKLCLFLHHFSGNYFPVYVQYYLNELTCHFDEVKMVTNTRAIANQPKLLNPRIEVLFVQNEGYDFGLFYKGFQSVDTTRYSQIACINDSNIVFGKLNFLFEWSGHQQADVWGLVDSHEKPWFSEHSNNYHVQSHFVVFNQQAIDVLPDFMRKIDIDSIMAEKDTKKLRRRIINGWEIGLTQFLLSRGLSCITYIDSHHIAIQKGALKPVNVFHKHYEELIKQGIPFVKKRLVMERSWKSKLKFRSKWSHLIRKYGEKNWEIDLLIDDLDLIKDYHETKDLQELNESYRKLIIEKTA